MLCWSSLLNPDSSRLGHIPTSLPQHLLHLAGALADRVPDLIRVNSFGDAAELLDRLGVIGSVGLEHFSLVIVLIPGL